jgi:hypothetical protein
VKKTSGIRKSLSVIASLSVLALMVVLVSSVQAQALSIDSFNTGEQSLSQQNSGTVSEAVAGGMLGGYRKIVAEQTVASNLASINVDVVTDPGALQLSATDSANYVVRVVWDGDSGSATTINPTGLGSVDLVFDNSEPPVQIADGILLSIIGWDGRDIDLNFTIYTDANNYSVATYQVRGNAFVSSYDVALCFFEGCFTPAGANGGADFTNVGAIVLEVESVQAGADITLDLTFVDPTRDFGDLPDSYTTLIPSTTSQLDVNEHGARHSRGNSYLGNCVTRELNGQPDLAALVDGCDNGIEPIGTNPQGQWQNIANGGAVRVTWSSPDLVSDSFFGNGSVCLDGWVNWDHRDPDPANHTFETSANFTAAQKHVVQGLKLATTSFTSLTRDVTFNVPAGYFPGGAGSATDLAARWRIYPVDSDGNCPTGGLGLDGYKGYIINGEVEDYIWGFTPTAVSLQSFTPASTNLPILGLVAVAALAVLSFGVYVVRRERSS